ncbi:unnamed protein product [Lepeophtheirus salmonis]|uniref:(salmon louse) hypothetical protein n=1 Tax=Lepeophtheirus salmonis TaxID=72036 RepID=A0A7R8HAU1_LEPSM|nr:unnamed protein product [Lepeophtheirus salmonis]CAF2971754.1 unnamed protein product [Lepeophtheirus salmonis]
MARTFILAPGPAHDETAERLVKVNSQGLNKCITYIQIMPKEKKRGIRSKSFTYGCNCFLVVSSSVVVVNAPLSQLDGSLSSGVLIKVTNNTCSTNNNSNECCVVENDLTQHPSPPMANDANNVNHSSPASLSSNNNINVNNNVNSGSSSNPSRRLRTDKERRRRERRERRARRQLLRSTEDPHRRRPYSNMPDILHSHVPPPYSTLPNRNARPIPPPSRWRRSPPSFPAAVTADLTRSHASFFDENHHHIHHLDSSSHTSKSCCGVAVNQTISIRWFIVMIAFVGICCSVVGTILGALKASGREHLTVSLLMIGVGIVLITVSGIAWRLTSPEGPSCRSMLGLSGEADDEYNGRFLSRPSGPLPYGNRPQHPYAAMMYSDFQYRPPPPSYQASMQEYRLRLLLMDRHSSTTAGGIVTSTPSGPISPPPNYFSRMVFDSSQFSRPPSYRSHSSDQNLSAIQENNSSIILDNCSSIHNQPQPQIISTNPIVHRRQNSSSTCNGSSNAIISQETSSEIHHIHHHQEPNQAKSVFNVLAGLTSTSETNNTMKSNSGKVPHVDSNLVTIVQTSESFALSNNNTNSLIVTVSGSLERPAISTAPLSHHHPHTNPQIRSSSGEVEILAHL